MAIIGTYEAIPMNSFVIRPHPMRLIIGNPITTKGLSPRDMDTLAARVQKAIEDLYYAHSYVANPRVAENAEIHPSKQG
jgi:1-acyl-sn-glycerol-3-phosphate acyltransferase